MRERLARGTTTGLVLLALAAVVVVAEFDIAPESVWVMVPPEWLAHPTERFALLLVVSSLALCAALAGWVDTRRRHPSMSGTTVAAAVLATAWASLLVAIWEDEIWLRAMGFVVTALLPIALLQIVVAAGPHPTRPAPRLHTPAVWSGAYLVVVVFAVLHVIVRDPFVDTRCMVRCDPLAVPLVSTALVEMLDLALRGVWASAGALTVLHALRALLEPTTGLHRARALAAAAAGGIEVAWAAAPDAAVVVGPYSFAYPALLSARLAAHGALAVLTAAILVRQARRQSHLQRMAREIVAVTPPSRVRAIISARLGDPDARIDFRIPGDRLWVDETGHPVPEAAAGGVDGTRQLAFVAREGRAIARIAFQGAEASAEDLEEALGPAAVLALEAERTRAEGLLRLETLRHARRRVVEESDAARRRAERDLHDGAQHLLLAATFAIQEALAQARGSGDEAACARLEQALADVTRIGADLRAVAHGMHPVLLGDAGLLPALEGLALTSPVDTSIDGQVPRRAAPSVELTIYQACALAVTGAREGPLSISITQHDGRLQLSISGPDLPVTSIAALSDRATALGGTMVTMAGSWVLEVPCA